MSVTVALASGRTIEAPKKLKVLVFIENDIVVRHFVHSGVLRSLIEAHDVKFVFPEIGNPRVTVKVDELQCGAPIIRLPFDRRRLGLWRKLFQISQLRWRPGSDWAALRRVFHYLLGWKASLLFRFYALPGLFQFNRWRLLRAINLSPNRAMDQLVQDERPDVVLHPSVLDGGYINDLVDGASRWSIPLVVIMNSWDNPSSKRSAVGNPSWLLVWGEQTKRHAIDFMQIQPERVVKFGAAQFDLFRLPPRTTRADFCRIINADPQKPLLLYAGSSKDTAEMDHLKMIEAAIDDGRLAACTVIYRPHPWGAGGRGGAMIADYAWRHVRFDPAMVSYLRGLAEGGATRSLPDYRDTHDLLSVVDAVVSPLSTILIEAALHRKAICCFLPDDEENPGSFHQQKNLVHFKDLFKVPEVVLARRRERLIDGLVTLLRHQADPLHCERLLQSCAYFVEPYGKPYGERLVEFLGGVVPDKMRSSA